MTDLRLAADLTLPVAVVTEPIGIFANRGKGKSNAAHLLVEQLYHAGQPAIVLDVKGDWYGIRSSRDGKSEGLPFLVLGGEHADVPLEEGSGRATAQLLAEQRVPTIVDLSAFSKTKARTWVMEFAEALYRVNREPLMLVVDEADVLIPQRLSAEMMRLLGAMEDIAKRGRQRGLGICVISQRVADVNKSVTDLLETLLLFAVTGVRTRKALLEWIDDHADPQQAKDVIATLSTLPPGECWVWSPGWLHVLQRVKLNRIETFDSHATPEPGKSRTAPRTFAEVDLAAIKEAMADSIEKAKADDPRELRKRIRELEAEADRVYKAGYDTGKMHAGERIVQVITDEHLARLDAALAAFATTAHDLAVQVGEEVSPLGVILDRLARERDQLPPIEQGTSTRVEAIQRESSAPRRPQSSPGVRITPGVPDHGKTREERAEMRPSASPARDITLVVADTSKSQQKILNALAWFKTVGIDAPTRGQVAFQARVSPKSSGFEKNCSTLRTRGLIDYPVGNRLTLTRDGESGAHWPERPGSSEDLQQAFYEGVTGPQATLLKHLVAIYPNEIDRESLADAVDVSAGSSGFEKNLSTLRSLSLIDYPAPGFAVATDLLFIGGGS